MLPRRLSTGLALTPTGARNSKIDIQKMSKRDGAGNPTWDIFAQNVWAKIQTLTSTYKDKAQQTTTEATHKIIISYMDGVTSAMRIRDSQGKIYLIEGSPNDPDGSRRELWINCYMRDGGVTGVPA